MVPATDTILQPQNTKWPKPPRQIKVFVSIGIYLHILCAIYNSYVNKFIIIKETEKVKNKESWKNIILEGNIIFLYVTINI